MISIFSELPVNLLLKITEKLGDLLDITANENIIKFIRNAGEDTMDDYSFIKSKPYKFIVFKDKGKSSIKNDGYIKFITDHLEEIE